MESINGASLFSSAGIAETYFEEAGINIKVANELLPKEPNYINSYTKNKNDMWRHNK